MAQDEITNAMLLRHMQAMKSDLEKQIKSVEKSLDAKMNRGFQAIHFELEEARIQRTALQEDMEANMMLLIKHDKRMTNIEKHCYAA